eukprot:Lankesteria_metandrocarpae@DN527_c0_g1_i2.p1
MKRDKSALATQAAPSDAPTDSVTGVPPLSFAATGKGYGGLSQSVMGMVHQHHAHHQGAGGVSFAKQQQQSDQRLRGLLTARLQQYLAEWLLAPETRILVKQLKAQLEPTQQHLLTATSTAVATAPQSEALFATSSTGLPTQSATADNLSAALTTASPLFQDAHLDSSSKPYPSTTVATYTSPLQPTHTVHDGSLL